jgi:hypothetical protein
MADPIHDLIAVAQATPDPRVVANWITAYLGKRPLEAKQSTLHALGLQCEGRTVDAREQRASGLVLRVIRKLQDELAGTPRTK